MYVELFNINLLSVILQIREAAMGCNESAAK